MRWSFPSAQYATPRCTNPLLDGVPFIHVSGSYTHFVLPVAASSAATWEREVLTYRTPSTISGVDSQAHVRNAGFDVTTSASTDRQVQAIFNRLKLSRSICERDEYFELAESPP